MKIIIIAIFAQMLLLPAARAGFDYLFETGADGRVVTFLITEADVLDSPVWKPTEPNPPLAARDAVKSAGKALELVVQEPGEWQISAITCKVIGPTKVWIYEIEFCRYASSGRYMKFVKIPVLLNGKVIMPIDVKEEKQDGPDGSIP